MPVPTEPPRTGVNLVPPGYVGWIRITTPRGRVKVRWVTADGIVFRDSHCWAGGRFHIERHAVFCRVEPCAVAAVATLPQQPSTDAQAHAALLSAGLPPHRLVRLP